MVPDSIRPTIAFLSGSGLPAWAWNGVRDELRMPTYVVDYLKGEASLAQHARAVLDGSGHVRLILVAHSLGGVVASQICAIAPDRIAGVIGVSAAFPPPGRSFLDTLPRRERLLMTAALRLSGTRPPASVLRRGYADELDDDTAGRLVSGFEAESRRLFTDPVGSPSFPSARGYVLTSRDRQSSPERQESYAVRLGATCRRELDAGHWPMLSRPTELGALLREFIETCPS